MKFHLLLGFFFVMSLAEDTEAGTFDLNACRAFKATATADSNFRYVTHGTHCYLFSKTEKHWTKAREFCKQKGADLVAINDEAENAFVHNMFHGDMSVPDYIAIGALYDASLGWHWVANNEKITFSKWDGGAVPEHVGSSKYGAMYNTAESWGHWGDDNEPFVCEETAPDPCFGINCLNGGECKDGNCLCANSYTGVHCEKAPDPCCSVKCQNGGKCDNGNCNCVNGYTGTRCEKGLLSIGSRYRFESSNYRNQYFRHRNYRIYKDASSSSRLYLDDSTFDVVSGLAGTGISLRSKNYPKFYLRHQNWWARISKLSGSKLFKLDASFIPRAGLDGSAGVSFESVNYPNHFLRHQFSRVRISRNDGSALFKKDATWIAHLV